MQLARTGFNSNGIADRFHKFGLTQREIQVAESLQFIEQRLERKDQLE